VIQTGHGHGFGAKALDHARLVDAWQELDRHVALETEILSPEDTAHAALTQEVTHTVTIVEENSVAHHVVAPPSLNRSSV